jgi:hypothetical protein
MTKTTTTHAAAAVLSVLVTFGVVAGMNGLATKQYAAAERVAQAADAMQVAVVQRVVVVGHRANV